MNKIIATVFAISAFLSCQNQTNQAAGSHAHFANTKDFICGMDVQADWTDTCSYKGLTYAFCNAGCMEEFLKEPEKHLAAQ